MPTSGNGPQSASHSELAMWPASPPRERADAARNRAAVLDAAARLFREHGVGNVSMDAIASAAGVGKGTLFRRFGDKAGLAVALLDERERELQQRVLNGPPPLGPGAPAGERLVAFFSAYLDYVLAHLDLSRMSETARPGARYRIGAYRFWHRHVSILLSDPDPARSQKRPENDTSPDPDHAAAAHMLLAMISAEHLSAMEAEIGTDRARAAILRVLKVATGTTAG